MNNCSQTQFNPCGACSAACDPTQLYTECGFRKLLPGYGIRVETPEDACNIVLSSFVPYTNSAPSNAEGRDGEMRINSVGPAIYYRINGVWNLIGGTSGSGVSRDRQKFVSTDGQSVFNLSGTLWTTSSVDAIDVYRNGVLQDYGVGEDYQYAAGVITFNSPLLADEKVIVIYYY